MSPELDKKLCEDFPRVFADRYGDKRKTCMCWGFPNDGWEPLIREAAAKIEAEIERLEKEDPESFKKAWEKGAYRAAQVKEKFGTLRFYMTSANETMMQAIEEAELKSASTCEKCSKPGKERPIGWIKTLCDECATK
jgi:hypothetical protein